MLTNHIYFTYELWFQSADVAGASYRSSRTCRLHSCGHRSLLRTPLSRHPPLILHIIRSGFGLLRQQKNQWPVPPQFALLSPSRPSQAIPASRTSSSLPPPPRRCGRACGRGLLAPDYPLRALRATCIGDRLAERRSQPPHRRFATPAH